MEEGSYASQKLEVRHPGLFRAVVRPGDRSALVRFSTPSQLLEVKKFICWYCLTENYGQKDKEQVLSSSEPSLEILDLINGVEYCLDFGIKTKGGGLHRPGASVLRVTPGVDRPPEEGNDAICMSELSATYGSDYLGEISSMEENWRTSSGLSDVTSGSSAIDSPAYQVTGLRTIPEEEKVRPFTTHESGAAEDTPAMVASSSSSNLNSFLSRAPGTSISTSSGKLVYTLSERMMS